MDKKAVAELKKLRKVKKDYERLKIEHELKKKPSSLLRFEKRHLRIHRAAQSRILSEANVTALWGNEGGLLQVALSEAKPALCRRCEPSRGDRKSS